ncbi:autophagy protein 16, interacts with Atg12p-Atg5p [Lecanora helva]
MPSWKDEYLSALQERDRKEKANQTLYHSYTKLADRTATLQTTAPEEAVKPQDEPNLLPNAKEVKFSHEKGDSSSLTSRDAIAHVRQDLSEAQRSRGLMEAKLQSVTEELKKFRIQSSLDNKRISELLKEKAILTTRMRDRDEELRGKAKLMEDVHDETVSLTLQLNMAEERSQKLQQENKDLVDRWMARVGEEADAMNKESKYS